MLRLCSLFLLAALPAHADDPLAKYRPAGEEVAGSINDADGRRVQRLLSRDAQKVLTPEKLSDFFRGLTRDRGRERSIDPPHFAPPFVVFTVRFERGPLDMRLAFDQEGLLITGMWFVPHQDAVPAMARNKTPLSPPFRGRWLVFWGGDTEEQNHHHGTQNQQYAFDLLGLDEKGQTRKGDGGKNEDYFAFGRPVLAPADGVVTQAIDGVDDNRPGSMNPYSALGNAVVIKHSAGEVSVLAHLKRGSLKVRAGQRVERGQELGLCGNSGNSSEPHLHYHLQSSTVIQDGVGIKVYFARENGEPYSPVKGDTINP